jgi:hypothetical protein
MGRLELSHVQIANLNMLLLIAECVRRDHTIACSRFGLDADQAEFLSTLSYQEILTLVAHLGDECLFPPRTDLIQVLSWPPQLAGALLLAHPPQPARPERPARPSEILSAPSSHPTTE